MVSTFKNLSNYIEFFDNYNKNNGFSNLKTSALVKTQRS